MKCLETQRGSNPMRVAKYSAEHGCTSGCSLRMSEACNQPIAAGQKRGLKRDSWFGHIRLADNLGQQGVRAMLQIKTGHALYPAKFIRIDLLGVPNEDAACFRIVITILNLLEQGLNWLLRIPSPAHVFKIDLQVDRSDVAVSLEEVVQHVSC
jgi:hypothetical protein